MHIVREKTNAKIWGKYRELWLDFACELPDNSPVKESTRQIILSVSPTFVPNYKDDKGSWGDSGSVMFSDGSEIRWDWDNGDFLIPAEGSDWCDTPLSYPWHANDPLYWKRSH